MDNDRSHHLLLGRIPNIRNVSIEPGLEPLILLGIPPLEAQLSPTEHGQAEGCTDVNWDGLTCGDGSGYFQSLLACRSVG